MALELHPPVTWQPSFRPPLRFPVMNPQVLQALQELASGDWQKVVKVGEDGGELHFFEHESGQVTDVKYLDP